MMLRNGTSGHTGRGRALGKRDKFPQFDQVVVVLPEGESRLLTRELLYTAVTRARERVWVVGGEDVVRQAIDRSVQRASGLGQLLWRTG